MAHPVTPAHMKSGALMAATINAAYGHVVVDKWGVLDPALAERQINAAAGAQNFKAHGPLSRGITDPQWAPDDFAHACGLVVS